MNFVFKFKFGSEINFENQILASSWFQKGDKVIAKFETSGDKNPSDKIHNYVQTYFNRIDLF